VASDVCQALAMGTGQPPARRILRLQCHVMRLTDMKTVCLIDDPACGGRDFHSSTCWLNLSNFCV